MDEAKEPQGEGRGSYSSEGKVTLSFAFSIFMFRKILADFTQEPLFPLL